MTKPFARPCLRAFCLPLFALSLGIVPVFAQSQTISPKADWANVKSLTTTAKIRVRLTDGRTVRGTFVSASDDSLVSSLTTGQESLSHALVSRVWLKSPSHRKSNMLVGLGFGAGAGLIIGAVADATCKTICFGPSGKLILPPLWGLVGLGVGAAIPTGRWRDVYRTN